MEFEAHQNPKNVSFCLMILSLSPIDLFVCSVVVLRIRTSQGISGRSTSTSSTAAICGVLGMCCSWLGVYRPVSVVPIVGIVFLRCVT